MFDSFGFARPETMSGRFVEGDGSSLAGSPFGDIASYQLCGACGNFHGAADGTGGGGLGATLNSDDRGGFGSNGKPSLSTTDAGTQITRSGLSWNTNLGQPAVITYAYRATAPGTMPEGTGGFSTFTSAQIIQSELSFQSWADVAGITFQRVTDSGSEFSNNAAILLGNYSSGQDGAAAFAYLPFPTANRPQDVQGDVWINSTFSYNTNPTALGYGPQVYTHEIGHAIGLSHPANYNASPGQGPLYGPNATYFEDSRQYTVMSYFSETNTSGNFGGRFSAVPLLDDIAAAQRLYGANMNTRTGDTVYGFNSTADRPWFLATASTQVIFAVWDAGGTDTFDFSGYSMGQTIDLRQGAFSNVGGLTGNVAIAVGVTIENAIGGSGADTFRGNSADNRFTLNAGNDLVDGGLGSDTIVFSGARSAYTITWNGQTGTVSGNGQSVTVTNVEFLQFSDQRIAAAPTGGLRVAGDLSNETISGGELDDVLGGLGGNDVINGLAGADTLDGGSGDDVLQGGDGDDILIGNLGSDSLNGGDGFDIADYAGATGGVTVNLGSQSAGGAAGVDTLTAIEGINGSRFNDQLTGDDAANIIRGGGGVDTLSGGAGADQLFAGIPGSTGGAADIIKARATVNSTIATAVSLNGAFDLLARAGVEFADGVPHATVLGTASGQLEYYAVTVAAGDSVRFDIDGASFDATLRLFDAAGNELAQNDDAGNIETDNSGPTDSLLNYTFNTAGTYYIQVAQYLSPQTNPGATGAVFPSGPAPAGGRYQLNVSVPSAPAVADVFVGSTLNGDDGDDVLTGNTGPDTLNGGTGDDRLVGVGMGDRLDGGAGTDTAVFEGARSAYTLSVANGVTTISSSAGSTQVTTVERLQFSDGLYDISGAPVGTGPINGTTGADTLTGTTGADEINGREGDDVLRGLAGDDRLDGGSGTDTAVFSGSISSYGFSADAGGSLVVTGADGIDTLVSIERVRFDEGTYVLASGYRYFEGTANGDALAGTSGSDEMRGLGGNDALNAGDGDDFLIGGLGDDALDGGAGLDTAVFTGSIFSYNIGAGPNGGVSVVGADGADVIRNIERVQFDEGVFLLASGYRYYEGTNVGDVLTGSPGSDEMRGLTGNDTLNSGDGDDYLIGGLGNDTMDGGDGLDTAFFSGSISSYTITGAAGGGISVVGADGSDVITNVERIRFDEGVYLLASGYRFYEGTNLGDVLTGSPGSDEMRGLTGDDTLNAGDGDDFLIGGAGNDTMDGGAGLDTAFFGGSIFSYTITAGPGGGISVVGADGSDVILNVERVRFDEGVFLLASGYRYYEGTNVGDTLTGSPGSDEMRGLTGDDTLNSGDGDDYLIGGAGDDTLDGGAGLDTAFFSGSIFSYTITSAPGGGTSVVGADGSDVILNIERIRFDDGVFVLASGYRYYEGTNGGDTLNGSPGSDEMRGLDGNDVIIGGAGDDFLLGGRGDDTLTGGAGADTLEGGDGVDTATFSGNRSQYTFSVVGDDTYVTGLDGSDRILGVERFLFADGYYDRTGAPQSGGAGPMAFKDLVAEPLVSPLEYDRPLVLWDADPVKTASEHDDPQVLPSEFEFLELEPFAFGVRELDFQPFSGEIYRSLFRATPDDWLI